MSEGGSVSQTTNLERIDLGICEECGLPASHLVARQLNETMTLSFARCDRHCLTERDAAAVLAPSGSQGQDAYYAK